MPIISSIGALSTRGFGTLLPYRGPALLMHANNIADPTVFTNNGSDQSLIITRQGSAVVSPDQAKFGAGSIKLSPATSDRVNILGPSINIDSGDFTIEAWIYPTATNGPRVILSRWQDQSYVFSCSDGLIGLTWAPQSNTEDLMRSSGPVLPLNTWSHVGLTREGNTWGLWQNGARVAQVVNGRTASRNDSIPTVIGAYYIPADPTPRGMFQGYMDEVRITKERALYSGTTYAVPTVPFPPA